MPVLTATNLHKTYGPRVLLDGVTLSVHSNERVGVVGSNGSGKSTLAKILAGLEPADVGTVAVRRGAEVAYLAQEPVLDGAHTAREAVEEGLGAWRDAVSRHEQASTGLASGEGDVERLLAAQAEAAADVERLGGWDRSHQIDAMLGHLGVRDPSARIASMSGGEKRRVALAKILVAAPALAILDEPTNHLDVEAIEWLEAYLADTFPGALVLVTHDRYVLDRVVDRTLEVENGRVHSYDGGWDAYLEAKAERLAQEERAEANRRNFLRTELEWLRRSPAARSTKQKARIQRAQSAIAAQRPADERTAELRLDTTRLGGTVLDVRALGVDVAGRTLVEGLSMALRRGERIGIVGPNGSGKTSLLRVLLGESQPTRGEVVVGKNTRFAYFDQGRSGLDDDASVQENVAGDRTRIDVGGETIDIRTYLSRFLFQSDRLRQKVSSLSGGERARVALAKLLLQPANLLVLDEPTNDLDVATLSALEQMIVEAEATALVVSHDRYFLDRVATSILAFEGDGRVLLYPGNYDMYRRLRAQAEAELAATRATQAKIRAPAPAKEASAPAKKGLTYKERLELDGMLETIEQAESALRTVEAELADPSLYAARGAGVPALVEKQATLRGEVERLMARWEELEARR